MEEILASIRRIISEEGQEQPGGDALSQLAVASEPAPLPPAPKPAAPKPVAQPVAQPAAVVPEDDDEDDLVLTEVVTATADPMENNVVKLKPEPKAEVIAEPESVDDDIEFAMDEPMISEPLISEPMPEIPAGEAVLPTPSKAKKAAAPTRGWADPEPDDLMTAAPEPEEFTQMTEELPDLIAPEVADAATASFAQLLQPSKKAPDVTQDRPTGDGLLVETLVRQAVEPLLKAWLDQHLEPIVEKIVRREVERLARKAELG
jgi:hypothetical protein